MIIQVKNKIFSGRAVFYVDSGDYIRAGACVSISAVGHYLI